jgi:hypothetical protein
MARVVPAEWRVNLAWLCPTLGPKITRNLKPWEKFVFAHTASEKSVSGVSRRVAEYGDRASQRRSEELRLIGLAPFGFRFGFGSGCAPCDGAGENAPQFGEHVATEIAVLEENWFTTGCPESGAS